MTYHRLMSALLPLVICLAAPPAHAQWEEHGISLSPALVAVSGFGTNPAVVGAYTYSFFGGRWFVEGSIGVGSVRSKVLESVSQARLFETDRLVFYQFGTAFDYSPRGPWPHLIFGVAGLNQGGQSKFAGVLGFGKRIPLQGVFGGNALGVRYDVRDLIFSQQVNNGESFVAHNIVMSVGLVVTL